MWIRLRGIQVHAFHGVHDFEREQGGRFEIDLDVSFDGRQAAATDNVKHTIDYVALHRTVAEISASKKFHLIESLAATIAERVLADFPADEVIVRVRKPGAPVGGVVETVEVECQRRRNEE